MRDALSKDSRIHRDLSAGNIILVKEPGCNVRKGYLIDWEVSDRVDDAGEALHAGRTVGRELIACPLFAVLTVLCVSGHVGFHVDPYALNGRGV